MENCYLPVANYFSTLSIVDEADSAASTT